MKVIIDISGDEPMGVFLITRDMESYPMNCAWFFCSRSNDVNLGGNRKFKIADEI